jgi:hypothetical protein
MENVQKVNNCINVPSSQTCRSHLLPVLFTLAEACLASGPGSLRIEPCQENIRVTYSLWKMHYIINSSSLHEFLTSTLDECEWSVSSPRPLYHQGKSPRYPLDRKQDSPQSQSGRCGKENIFCLCRESKPIPRPSSPSLYRVSHSGSHVIATVYTDSLLFYNQMQDLIIREQVEYNEWDFLWASQVSPGKRWDSTSEQATENTEIPFLYTFNFNALIFYLI